MQNSFDFDAFIGALAKSLMAHIQSEMADVAAAIPKARLLTVDQAATYMGRTEEAMQHMIANRKVPTVRIDRRVLIDIRDLDELIKEHKTSTGSVR